MMQVLFDDCEEQTGLLTIKLGQQTIRFIAAEAYKVEVILACDNTDYANKELEIGNLTIRNSSA